MIHHSVNGHSDDPSQCQQTLTPYHSLRSLFITSPVHPDGRHTARSARNLDTLQQKVPPTSLDQIILLKWPALTVISNTMTRCITIRCVTGQHLCAHKQCHYCILSPHCLIWKHFYEWPAACNSYICVLWYRIPQANSQYRDSHVPVSRHSSILRCVWTAASCTEHHHLDSVVQTSYSMSDQLLNVTWVSLQYECVNEKCVLCAVERHGLRLLRTAVMEGSGPREMWDVATCSQLQMQGHGWSSQTADNHCHIMWCQSPHSLPVVTAIVK